MVRTFRAYSCMRMPLFSRFEFALYFDTRKSTHRHTMYMYIYILCFNTTYIYIYIYSTPLREEFTRCMYSRTFTQPFSTCAFAHVRNSVLSPCSRSFLFLFFFSLDVRNELCFGAEGNARSLCNRDDARSLFYYAAAYTHSPVTHTDLLPVVWHCCLGVNRRK